MRYGPRRREVISNDLWRIRLRQYRVIYQILDAKLIVTIMKVGDRKDVCR